MNNQWELVLKNLQKHVSKKSIERLMNNTTQSISGDRWIIVANNEDVKEWLKESYLSLLEETIHDVTKKQYNVVIITKTKDSMFGFNKMNLNSEYSFENFIGNIGNQHAVTVSKEVAATYKKDYNPLYIYGKDGLGKSHLLHSIGNLLMENQPSGKVIYTTGQQFIDDCSKNISSVMNTYPHLDLLLLDDVQSLNGEELIQERLFNLIQFLDLHSKRVVISSDCCLDNLDVQVTLRKKLGEGIAIEIKDLVDCDILDTNSYSGGVELDKRISTIETDITEIKEQLKILEEMLKKIK